MRELCWQITVAYVIHLNVLQTYNCLRKLSITLDSPCDCENCTEKPFPAQTLYDSITLDSLTLSFNLELSVSPNQCSLRVNLKAAWLLLADILCRLLGEVCDIFVLNYLSVFDSSSLPHSLSVMSASSPSPAPRCSLLLLFLLLRYFQTPETFSLFNFCFFFLLLKMDEV